MRFNQYILIFFCLLTAVIVSCDKKDHETELDKFNKQLDGSWIISSATLDGVDMTPYTSGLKITFSATSFTTTNGLQPLWNPSSNFQITGTEAPFHIVRDDGIDMQVVSITNTRLVLEFHYEMALLRGGRTHSLSGNYHIELSRM